jgi:VWFA-related protein
MRQHADYRMSARQCNSAPSSSVITSEADPVIRLIPSALLIALADAQQPDVVFQSSTGEVLLEVVVRDSHGKLVKVDPSQVSVYEDGVRQEIRSFHFISGREVRAADEKQTAQSPSARPASNPLRTVNVVCLVLNDINSATRGFAYDAARKFVNRELRPDTFIGIFTLDTTGLKAIFPFSNNREHLLKAVELASVNQLPALNPSTGVMLAGVTAIVPNFELRTNMGSAVIDGLREIDALSALVKQLRDIPYRKTVLLMSTGLTRPPDQLEVWDSLIKSANEARVTFYSLDLFGLGVCQDSFGDCQTSSTPTDSANAFVRGAAALSQGQSTSNTSVRSRTAPGGSSTPGGSSAQQMMESMHQTDYLRFGVLSANTQEALRELSESTGGFIIANTNNTDALLARVMDEVDTHYEVTYHPASLNDGHFKRIEVKLANPSLRVETRPGYFAVPETVENPLTPSDMTALKSLDTKPQPHAFEFQAAAFQFKSQYAIAFEVPISSLTSTAEPEQSAHRFHGSLLALIKDANGEVVERVSKEVTSTVPDRALPALMSESMTYEHAVNLRPGHYMVETAVVDDEGNRASVRTFPIDSRETTELGLSDLILVRRVQPLDRAPDRSDPFELPGKRTQPYISSNLSAAAPARVLFTVYTEKPGVKVETTLLKNGKPIQSQASTLPAPDATGAIPTILEFTSDPGDYELQVIAAEGERSVHRTIKYSLTAR